MIEELKGTGAQIKTVEPELIHVTLKFLGDIEESLVPKVKGLIVEATNGCSACKVNLKGSGAFPGLSNIRVVWVGMEGAEPIKQIACNLDAGLTSLGFQREARPFTPHVTVGRMKGARGENLVREVIQRHKDQDFGEVSFSSIRLKKSVLSPKGPSYYTMEEVPLKC